MTALRLNTNFLLETDKEIDRAKIDNKMNKFWTHYLFPPTSNLQMKSDSYS